MSKVLLSYGTYRTYHIVLVAFSSFAVASAVSDVPLTSDRIFPSISLFMLLSFPLAMVCFRFICVASTDQFFSSAK